MWCVESEELNMCAYHHGDNQMMGREGGSTHGAITLRYAVFNDFYD